LKRISFRDVGLIYTFDSRNDPVAHVAAGDTVVLDVEDAFSGKITAKALAEHAEDVPFGNPIVGPIFVEGADVGNTLSVFIKDIRPATGRGITYLSQFTANYLTSVPIFEFMKVELPAHPRICKIENELIYFSDKITIPYRPMIGTIGVTPLPEAESISSVLLPGRHGGNMDIPDISRQSTVFFPIFQKGALLYMGDAHAAQGDGEISGEAIEMPAEITVELNVIKEKINWPRIETDEELMSVATTSAARGLEDAIRTSFMDLSMWMERKYDINRFDALVLLSQVGKIRIGNLWTAVAKIEKKYLE